MLNAVYILTLIIREQGSTATTKVSKWTILPMEKIMALFTSIAGRPSPPSLQIYSNLPTTRVACCLN